MTLRGNESVTDISPAVKWCACSRETLYSTASNMKLLPLLCLLSLWLGPASAQEMRVVTVEEDTDAVLPCSSNGPVQEFDWKKDENKEVFLYTGGSHKNQPPDEQLKGRVSIFIDELSNGNASIKISSTELNDSGIYKCILGPLDKPSKQEFYIRLHVVGVLKIRRLSGAAPEPGVKKLNGTGDWSLLQCKAYGVPKPVLKWKDSSGTVLNPKEPKVTKSDKRFYVTSELNVTKTDHYTCVATQKEILHQINNTVFEVFQVQHKDDSEFPVAWIVVAVLGLLLLVLCVCYIVNYVRRCHKPQPENGKQSNEEGTPSMAMTNDQPSNY